jgi:competence protein ComEC
LRFMAIRDALEGFWERQPALFVGLNLLLGCASALHWDWCFVGIGIALWASGKWRLGIFLVLAAFVYAKVLYPTPDLSAKQMEGVAEFEVSTLKPSQSPFQRSLLYKGQIKHFRAKTGEVAHHLPCNIYMPVSNSRPKADCSYRIEGTLHEKAGRFYLFKPLKKKPWERLEGTSSFAEGRFRAKEGVRAYLKKHLKNAQCCNFLTALATGDLEDRTLAFEFGRLGLQHILAISGFHFALIAAFCSFFLRLFLPYKVAAGVLLVLLSVYFFFIGNAPSVQRAWIAIFLFLIGQLCDLRTSGLNALGLGLIVEILIDPLLITHVGFQLSFLATLAILMLYPVLNGLLGRHLRIRPLSTLVRMNRLHQHGYILSSLIRQALALNLSVHLVAIPAVLFLFHKFPLLSLVYNLFFPVGVSLSLLLLLLAIPLTLLMPPLGELIHGLNNAFTSWLLTLTSHPPAFLDFAIRTPSFPLALLLGYIAILFFLVAKNPRSELYT